MSIQEPTDDQMAAVELRNMTEAETGVSGDLDVHALEITFEGLALDEYNAVLNYLTDFVSCSSADAGHGTDFDDPQPPRFHLDLEMEPTREGYDLTVADIGWM